MNLAVIGTGLLGASVAMAAKKNIEGVFITCFDKKSEITSEAVSRGVCDKAAISPADCVKGADIVVIASPIFTFKDLYLQIRDYLKNDCVVTDTGSTKTMPVRWAMSIFKTEQVFIGSHPIAGSENSGFKNARESLFEGAKCVITLYEGVEKRRFDIISQFWQSLGCKIVTMTTEQHDRLYGALSHLPHAAAASLVNAVKDKDLSLAGNGFKDTTRIASGNPDVWADIFLSNAENLTFGVNSLINSLNELKEAVQERNREKIAIFLDSAAKRRRKIDSLK